MESDYDTVKKALFSLMCVGDWIYRIYTNTPIHFEEQCYTIVRCKIIEILEDTIKITRMGSNGYVDLYKAVDMHEGKLYIWNTGSEYYKLPPRQRREKLIEILESKNTVFESNNHD